MSTTRLIFEKQGLHLVLLSALLAGVAGLSRVDRFFEGESLGLSTRAWFYLSVAAPIVHQWYVWFCWRTELHLGWITRVFGKRGFPVYATVFGILLLSRPVMIVLLAISNRGTLPVHAGLLQGLAVMVCVPAVYAFYSVARYFGFRRAAGADHFDKSYRGLPLVKEGIFRFTSNGMYTFALLILWVPGLLTASVAAITAALFNHSYIWVHYFCTEKPDMQRIYGAAGDA